MAKSRPDVPEATLDLLVFRVLDRRGSLRGSEIASHIEETAGQLSVEEGALYRTLHRMEKSGWIDAEWKLTENHRRARSYSITDSGKQRYKDERRKWRTLTASVERVLRSG